MAANSFMKIVEAIARLPFVIMAFLGYFGIFWTDEFYLHTIFFFLTSTSIVFFPFNKRIKNSVLLLKISIYIILISSTLYATDFNMTNFVYLQISLILLSLYFDIRNNKKLDF